MSGYPGSLLAVRMAALIRMTERGLTREELADLAGMTPACVLEVGLHSPPGRARLAVALGWPPGYFDDSSTVGPAAPLPVLFASIFMLRRNSRCFLFASACSLASRICCSA